MEGGVFWQFDKGGLRFDSHAHRTLPAGLSKILLVLTMLEPF